MAKHMAEYSLVTAPHPQTKNKRKWTDPRTFMTTSNSIFINAGKREEEERKEQEEIYHHLEIKQNIITAHATLKLYLMAIPLSY